MRKVILKINLNKEPVFVTGESGLERFKTKKHSVFHAATNYRTQLKSNQKNIVLSGTHIQEFSALLYHTRKS